MKNRTYLKAGFREIRQSKGRFIAIIFDHFTRHALICRRQDRRVL